MLQKLINYGIIFNVRKSTMFVIEEVFLGFVVSRNGIAADPDKMAAIRNRKEPAITTEVRAFTNAAGYIRHLIKKYALFSSPLIDLIGGPKNQSLKLPPAAKAAWQKIREIITTMPVVKSFDWTLPAVIEADFSQTHAEEALFQPHMCDGQRVLYPVAYFSKKLTSTQTRYLTQKRELLAIMLCL
jgi:hypothetical protein